MAVRASCIRAQIRPRSAKLYLAQGRHPALDLVDIGLALDRRFADFRPNHLFRNPRFVGQPVGKLVALRRVGDPGRHCEHLPQERPPPLVR